MRTKRSTVGTVGTAGRTAAGKFAVGNTFAANNPANRKAQELRVLLLESVTAEDIQKALTTIREVMDSDKGNERLAAAEALLDRILGKPVAADFMQQLEDLQGAVERLAIKERLTGNGEHL